MAGATSTAYTGSGYFDDVHDSDYVYLSTNAATEAAEDLTVNGASGSMPYTPDNYNLKLDWLILQNATSSAINVTVSLYNGTTSIVLFTYYLAAHVSQPFFGDQFKLIAFPGWKCRVASDTSAGVSAYAMGRLTPGAGQ